MLCNKDTHTNGHVQWFYFSVRRANSSPRIPEKLRVRLNIVNMMKKSSLYDVGMLPVGFCEKSDGSGRGWTRVTRRRARSVDATRLSRRSAGTCVRGETCLWTLSINLCFRGKKRKPIEPLIVRERRQNALRRLVRRRCAAATARPDRHNRVGRRFTAKKRGRKKTSWPNHQGG